MKRTCLVRKEEEGDGGGQARLALQSVMGSGAVGMARGGTCELPGG
jgi:hypothetical protein